MSLAGALSIALTGLRATQVGADTVATNLAGAGAPGYARREVATAAQGQGVGAATAETRRAVDHAVARQMLVETANAGFAGTRASVLSDLDRLFGVPGEAGALDVLFNGLVGALEDLAADPASSAARGAVLAGADGLAARLNGLSDDIQALRRDAEAGIAEGVARADAILQDLARVEARRAGSGGGAASADLADARDGLIAELAGLIDLRVASRGDGGVVVTTGSGRMLFDGATAARLSFDGPRTLAPGASGGTIRLTQADGASVALVGEAAPRAGRLAGLIAARDGDLPAAQEGIDALAERLATALSSREVAGVPVAVGAASGFDVDLAGLLPGDRLTVETRDPGGATRRLTLIRVEDPGVVLADDATDDPDDVVASFSLAGGAAGAASQVQSALGAPFVVSNPGGTILRLLDDGAAGAADVAAVRARVTVTRFDSGDAAAPVFIDADGGRPYSGSYDGGAQRTGFAGRIVLNPALHDDPARLVVSGPGVRAGDPARPAAMLEQLTTQVETVATDWASGGTQALTAGGQARRLVSSIGARAAEAEMARTAAEATRNAVAARVEEATGVDVDREMGRLIAIQTAYAANARVLTAVRDMLDQLLRS